MSRGFEKNACSPNWWPVLRIGSPNAKRFKGDCDRCKTVSVSEGCTMVTRCPLLSELVAGFTKAKWSDRSGMGGEVTIPVSENHYGYTTCRIFEKIADR